MIATAGGCGCGAYTYATASPRHGFAGFEPRLVHLLAVPPGVPEHAEAGIDLKLLPQGFDGLLRSGTDHLETLGSRGRDHGNDVRHS
jgi:hypothetical protein